MLQRLHLEGGALTGKVEVKLATGAGAFPALALCRRLGIPADGKPHTLTVNIFHDEQGMHWLRQFDSTSQIISLFKPVGTIDTGYWIEESGPLRFALKVDIIDGGWHWRPVKLWLFGVRMPQWLLIRSTAYKRIQEDRYCFYVGFSVPILGTLISYSGKLQASPSTAEIGGGRT